MIPSKVEWCSRNGWYILRASVISCQCSGMPSLMVEVSEVMLASLVVAMRTLFQWMACKECKEMIASMWVTSSISGSGCSDCVMAEMSSCRCILNGWVSPVGCHDIVSDALLHMPGMYMILNL